VTQPLSVGDTLPAQAESQRFTSRPIRSFVLRQGRFSTAQERAFNEAMPKFGVPYVAQAAPIDLNAVFGHAPAQPRK
jgi:hypothetical protein